MSERKEQNPYADAAALMVEWWSNAGFRVHPVYVAMGCAVMADGTEALFPVGPLRTAFADALADGYAKNASVALLMRAVRSDSGKDDPKDDEKPTEPIPSGAGASALVH